MLLGGRGVFCLVVSLCLECHCLFTVSFGLCLCTVSCRIVGGFAITVVAASNSTNRVMTDLFMVMN